MLSMGFESTTEAIESDGRIAPETEGYGVGCVHV
jgi:hypothetical protein